MPRPNEAGVVIAAAVNQRPGLFFFGLTIAVIAVWALLVYAALPPRDDDQS